ncbi:SusC/RagA family TonB-linked outer membrane protein [Pedobacter hartonius]|uniref:TonB-linked outer membrane protein, SusC/RagA family n=1 Tax=Pedobacter hartonius TaxID=425514 RepID=A0A1H3WLQ9_9SPHI|nr:TonB-dependent receptor [Pedobacter hartonius]SDZ88065.1 TonB-linked outer membrane protein, SusC/RagA family [Pedobacter hartonius]
MKKILLIFLALSLCTPGGVFAQNKKIGGRVTSSDNGMPLPGVSVKVSGSRNGVQTDSDGSFTLNLLGRQYTIVFSFIGYLPQTITIGSNSTYNVKLVSDQKQLNDVVVIGYGSESKRTITGAISRVKAAEIQGRPVTGLDQALQGLVAGVQVTSASGTPGGAVTVRVRGVSTINADSQPLYVIDGTPIQTGSNSQIGFGNGQTNALNDINPNDIESIDVLKDAAAAAIYGSRASNGVVIVTTRRGKSGKTSIDLDYYTGIQKATARIDALTGPQYVQLYQDAVQNRYAASIGTPAYPTVASYISAALNRPLLANDPGTYPTTNWQDQVFRNAPISNYNLSINGGTEKTRFNITSGYFDQDGILKGSDYNRFNMRLNLDHTINDKFKIGTSTSFNRSTSSRINNDNNIYGVLSSAILLSPAINAYNADGTYGRDVYSSVENPIAAYKEPLNLTTAERLLSNIYGEYKLLPSLTFKTNFAADDQIYHERRFVPSTLNAGAAPTNGSGIEAYYSDLNLLNENILTFNKSYGDHSFSILGGQSWQKDNNETLFASGTNFPGNDIRRLSAAAVKTDASSAGSSSTLVSFFGRANYSYKNRYIFSATLRSDGSSRFADGHRYGYFPAISGAWLISDEAFMKNISWVSTLKLRSSWGKTGNNFVNDFASRTLISAYNTTAGQGISYAGVAGLYPSQLGDPNLTWEKTTSTDIAVDFGFLKDRITLSADVYYRKTNDLLAPLPLAGSTGFTTYTTNAGSMYNKGLELDLQTINIKSTDFSWTTNFNISFNRNKILSLANNNAPYASGFGSWVQVGDPIGAFRGYKVSGIFQNQAEIDQLNTVARTKTGNATALYQVQATAPGDIRFEDLNGDGVITSEDQTILGSAQPKFVGGLSNSFKYKMFDLSMLWQFSYGNKVLNWARSFAEGMNAIYGQFATTLDRWTPTHTDTEMPRAVLGDPNTNNRVSDRFIENGSYLRMKNLSLGFSLPDNMATKLHVRKLRIFAAAQNLATVTKYKGFDPEVSTFNSTPASAGTDFLTAPQAKTFTFGVNIGF